MKRLTYAGLRLALASAAYVVFAMTSPAAAAEFPDHPIRVIVPYAAGGVDVQMRVLAPALSKLLGQQVIVENRDGGGATIGTMAVKNAAPDGYTLLFTGTAALAVVPQMLKNVGYSADDFVPIGNVTGTPLTVGVRADAPYKTLDEMLAYAKANPGKINMGSSGPGTTMHIVGEAFQVENGVEFTHIPYKGSGPAIQGVVGGYADIVFGVPGGMVPQIQADKMRALATMGTERISFLPDVPTLVEKGIKQTEITRFGIFAPRGIPAAAKEKLVKAVAQAVQSKEFEEAMVKGYTTALYLPPAELGDAVKHEYAYWKEMLATPRFQKLLPP